MPLHLYERPNGIFHIRGTVQGERFDRSSKTRSRSQAEQIRAKWERDAFTRAVYGERAVGTFADAVALYIKAGGEPTHLDGLLDAFGSMKLSDITQRAADDLAAQRKVKPATLVRQLYTPLLAILNLAADQGMCDAPRIRKPIVKSGRTDFLTPAEAEAWIEALPPYLSRLVIFLVATGFRITEALELRWRDISPKGERIVLWETKPGYARGVDLQARARWALGERRGPLEHVFLNSFGEPWHGYDATNLMLKRHRIRRPELRPVNNHLFRHTWATWAYAVTRDLTFLMAQGGWTTPAMVMRYTHAGSPDLADAVRSHGWEIRGRWFPQIGVSL